MNKISDWDNTIVALATPQGVGAIGVIRVSGKKTFDILNELFPSKDLLKQKSHTLHVGLLKNENEILDEVVLSLFKNPTSYTGEDVIEISCHGSHFIQQKIIEAIIAKGARMAKPGEFTQRAFLNGKLDLTQAEAVADIIASNTEASKNAAIKNMRGGFSTSLKNLREELIKFSALIELELDFSQEDIEFADRTELKKLITNIQSQTQNLIQSFSLGNVIKNGVQVAIIGKPNAGKSTLLNALLNEERSIVSDIAGTTRDTVEEILNIDGILFRLIDTAGIRHHTQDVIEQMGVQRSLEKMQQADVIIYLFDVNEMNVDELSLIENNFKKEKSKYILVANKIDEPAYRTGKQKNNSNTKFFDEVISISAKQQQGISILKTMLKDLVVKEDVNTESVIVTNARHVDALQKLSSSLDEVLIGLNENKSGDLIALDIRECLYYLGLITGEVTTEDQLDFIFSKFCIGK